MIYKAGITVLLSFTSIIAFGQNKLNIDLKNQLDSILADDQRYRSVMAMQLGEQRDSVAHELNIPPDRVNEYFSQLQDHLDSLNLLKVEHIFATYGYPGKRLVGIPTNESAYYVIQHSSKIKQYFPLIKEAGRHHELPYALVALMEDRVLTEEGKEQIFGSQLKGYPVLDTPTGQHKIVWFVWPIKDPAHVNKRRKKAGFNDTVEQNAAELGAVYKVESIDDVRKKCPWFFPSNK